MSLINQVLRDLDARRDRPAPGNALALEGLGLAGRRAAASRTYWPRVAAFVTALAALGMGWSLWGPWTGQPQPAAEAARVPLSLPGPSLKRTRKLKQSVISTLDAPVPVAEPEASPQPSATVETIERTPKLAATTEPKQALVNSENNPINSGLNIQTRSDPDRAGSPETAQPTTDPGDSGAAPAHRIEKRTRPLSPRLQSEQAYQDALNHLRQGRIRIAEDRLSRSLSLYADHGPARVALAGLHLQQGRMTEAQALLAEGLERSPGEPTLVKFYSRSLLQDGRTDEALGVLEQGRNGAANDPEYHALAGAIYQQRGEPAKAAEAYSSALAMEPRQGAWWLGLGISLEQTGDRAGAGRAYEQAKTLQLEPVLRRYVEERLRAVKS